MSEATLGAHIKNMGFDMRYYYQNNFRRFVWMSAWILTAAFMLSGAALAQSTAFTYQGKLSDNGTPATGTYEMRFRLFNQSENGFEFGTPKIIPNIAVTNGVFTVTIDVGDWTFDQNDRFMEIAVRPQGNPNPFTVLAPLQQITLAPKAIFSDAAALADHSGSSDFAINSLKLNGLDASRYAQKNVNGEIVAPRLENLASDPAVASAANAGRIYFNTTTKNLMVSNGTAWTSASSRIQTFSGENESDNFDCTATTTAIRSVTFTKSSAASRLRITVRDVTSAVGPGAFYLFLNTRIDGSFVSSPTNFRVITLSSYDDLFSSRNSTVRNTFTTVGYANGIAAGTHTFTTTYSFQVLDIGGTYTCKREPDAYLIEIEEIP